MRSIPYIVYYHQHTTACQFLNQMDRCICGQIVEILPLAQSTVSQHLKCLKETGLIKGQVEGLFTCYCLDRAVLERFKRTAALL